MNDKINNYLTEIEKFYGVKILSAVEGGSRLWGFASPNSDYDVRFIYVRPLADYLSVFPSRDVIERMTQDKLFDFVGWDFKKSLLLIYRSNPALIEHLFSTIVYRENEKWISWMRKLAEMYFNPKTLLYHYFALGYKNHKRYIEDKDEVNYKKYFYVLRALMACEYIEKFHKIPPVSFQTLLDESTASKSDVEKMLEIKTKELESWEGVSFKLLDDWICDRIKYYSTSGRVTGERNQDQDKLNGFFQKYMFGEFLDEKSDH